MVETSPQSLGIKYLKYFTLEFDTHCNKMYSFNAKSLWIKVSAHINAIEVMVNKFDKKGFIFCNIMNCYLCNNPHYMNNCLLFLRFTVSYCNIPELHSSLSQGKLFDSCVKLHVLFLTLVSAMFAVTLCFLLFFHIWLLASNKTTLGKTCISHIHIYYKRFCTGNNISPSFCQSGCQFPFLWMDQQVRRLTWPSRQTSSRCLERTRVSGPFQYSAGQCYTIFIVLTRCLTPINNLQLNFF